MLQWVLFTMRRLRPEELYFAVLAGTDTAELGAWDRSEVDNKATQRFITSTSKGLIEVRKGTHADTVQFIHESVNDFLIRNQRLQKLDLALEPYAIGASHDRLASCCMSYIMRKELDSIVTSMLQREKLTGCYPFLEYASTQVLAHAEKAQAGCVSQEALLQRLQKLDGDFDRLKGFHDVFRRFYNHYNNAGLLYALSLGGYYQLVRLVLLELKADVNAQGGQYGSALQAAASFGPPRLEVVALLLKHGADVNASGGEYGSAVQLAMWGSDYNKAVVELLLKHGATGLC